MKGTDGMAFFSDLARAVAQAEGMDEMTVVGIGQYLRDEGLITKGGRGRSAARMSCRDAANLLIAVNAAPLAKHAADTVRGFGALRHSESSYGLLMRIFSDFVSETSTFCDALEKLIACGVSVENDASRLDMLLQKEKDRSTTRTMKSLALRRKLEIPMPIITISFVRPKNHAIIRICTSHMNVNQDEFQISDDIGHSINFTDLSSSAVECDRKDLTTITDATLRRVSAVIST